MLLCFIVIMQPLFGEQRFTYKNTTVVERLLTGHTVAQEISRPWNRVRFSKYIVKYDVYKYCTVSLCYYKIYKA